MCTKSCFFTEREQMEKKIKKKYFLKKIFQIFIINYIKYELLKKKNKT